MQGHSSFITHIDWSEDSQYLRSNSGDYELLYCTYYNIIVPFRVFSLINCLILLLFYRECECLQTDHTKYTITRCCMGY